MTKIRKNKEKDIWQCVICGKKFGNKIEHHSHIVNSDCGKTDPAKPMYTEIKIESNNISEEAGKQNAEIAVSNAIMIATQLSDECWKKGNKAIGYALEWQLTYLNAANKHLSEQITTTNNL